MLAQAVVEQISQLLQEGRTSQRKIARRLGVSRGTVSAIAHGERPDYLSVRGGEGDDFFTPLGPPRRCPGCGGMVYMPCLLCHIRGLPRVDRHRRAG
jgi:hypothetical protein